VRGGKEGRGVEGQPPDDGERPRSLRDHGDSDAARHRRYGDPVAPHPRPVRGVRAQPGRNVP
ncbi:MAG: hypothetical protein AVDCRST_MAG25-351, partial [uncultured Rubrobacteraceae bacterium]